MGKLLSLIIRSEEQTLYTEVKAQKLKPDIYLIFNPKPDQLGLRASDPKRPQTLNRYTYVNNDPVNYIDRSGLDDEIADIGTVVQLTTREPGNSLTSPKDILHEIFEIELPPNDEGGGGGSPVSFIDQDKQRRDALKSAMKLALDAIKNRATCRAAISGPARYGRYPDQLLQKLANANQIIFGDGSKTANVGLEAVIQLDKDLFIHHSLPLSMWISHLTTDLAIAQAVELLHELSHATGGTTHEGFTPRFSSTVKLTPRELNERIFNACFGPQPNRAIGRKDED